MAATGSRFSAKVVLISGAARGMGRAHALAFAREGAHLALCDACHQYETVPYPLPQPQELATLVGEIEGMGGKVIAEQADVTHLNEMQAFAEHTQRELGPIDIVVANA
ncbi:MAG: SDR family NAD(P)-dependent oxidoreductase, partial [Ktedonobacteraceae bacterium]